MDGFTLSRDVRELLNENETSLFINKKNTYDYLYEAACDLNSKIKLLTNIYPITSVDGTQEYILPSDYSGLYLKDSYEKYFITFDTGNTVYNIPKKDYEEIYALGNTDEIEVPNSFSIKDYTSTFDRITGTVTSSSASSTTEECTLFDTSSPTKFENVNIGDTVHNITDGSHGIIISKVSNTALVTCLFDGIDNDWTDDDIYYIIPQGRMSIYFDSPLSTSGYSIIINYIQKPDPVYSLFSTYRFNNIFRFALTKYASWLYKYRDREPNYGDGWYKYYDDFIRKQNANLKVQNNKNKYKVYLTR